MTKRNDIDKTFFMSVRMMGIERPKPNKFFFQDKAIFVDAYVNSAVATAFGGRNRAFKLLRYARVIELVCSGSENGHLFGVVDKSFDELSRKYPLLRSYYEVARLGGFQITWMTLAA